MPRMHAVRRTTGPSLDGLDLLMYARDHGREAALEVIRHDPAGMAERWAREYPGTRPPLWLDALGVERRLLRVLLPRVGGPFYVHESEAAALARMGLLLPEELRLWQAGTLPREDVPCFPDLADDPTTVVVDAPTWEALGPDGRRELVEGVRARRM